MVICWPLMVKGPAVIGEPKPAVPIVILESVALLLIGAPTSVVPFSWAAVANWLMLKANVPWVAPVATLAVAMDESDVWLVRLLYRAGSFRILISACTVFSSALIWPKAEFC